MNIIGSSCGEPSGRGDFIIRGGDVDLDAAGRNVVGDCLGDDVCQKSINQAGDTG